MKKLIDWLFERVCAFRVETAQEAKLVVKVEELEKALGGTELPNQYLTKHKCSYRRLVEDCEEEGNETSPLLEKCVNCSGYNYDRTCADYVSVEELTKFYDIFKER